MEKDKLINKIQIFMCSMILLLFFYVLITMDHVTHYPSFFLNCIVAGMFLAIFIMLIENKDTNNRGNDMKTKSLCDLLQITAPIGKVCPAKFNLDHDKCSEECGFNDKNR